MGVVIALAVVGSVDEAVKLANASEYSASAGLWTKDVHSAFDVAERIRARELQYTGYLDEKI